jgi:hypothetical protein
MGGLKRAGFGFDQAPTCPHSGTAAIGHDGDWCYVWSACTPNHLRPTSNGTLRALSQAAESGKTQVWRPYLPNGRRTEGVIRVVLVVHVILLRTTAVSTW